MKKNHVTGSLTVSGEKYRAMLRVPTADGGRKQIGIILDIEAKKGNKRKAEAKLKELIAQYEEKKIIDDDIKYFVDFLNWFIEFHRQNVSVTTYSNYKHMLDKHIVPYFSEKNMLLQNLTTGDLEEYFYYKQNEGLSPKTLKNHRALLSVALMHAFKKQYTEKNLMETLKRIRNVKKYEPQAYTMEEIIQLLSLAYKEKIIAPIFFCCMFGLRRSEALGLCYSDFDFDKKTVTLNRTVVVSTINHKTTFEIRQNVFKTENSQVTFAITSLIENFINQLMECKVENKTLFGNTYNYDYLDFLCVDEQGNLLKPDYVTHAFPKVLEKYNLKKIRFHELRHSFITNIQLINPNDMILKKIARHSNAEFTKNTYVQIQDELCNKTLREYLNLLSTEKPVTNSLQ